MPNICPPERRGHLALARPARAGACLGALLLLAAAPLALAETGEAEAGRTLETVEEELRAETARGTELSRQWESLTGEIVTLRESLIVTAAAVQDSETRARDLEERIAGLSGEEAVRRAALARGEAQLARTLAVLQRVAVTPVAAVAARGAGTEDTVRGAILLRTMVPPMAARAAGIRDGIRELAALRVRIAAERDALDSTLRGLAEEETRLAALLREKDEVLRRTDAGRAATTARMARLAAEAVDLRSLLSRLEQEQALAEEALSRFNRPENLPPFPRDGAGFRAPASGPVGDRFGAGNGAGGRNRGITIEARPGAVVVAPFDGRVVFAGPFRSYGEILIIEHAGGYHTLLAGFSRIDGTAGQWLLAGEPVGALPTPDVGNPTLYLELRRDGQPVDPMPWLTAQR